MIIGLTGGIVSGKSTVARMFKDLGAKIVDADKLGHQVILPPGAAWKRIIKIFGKDILQKDQTINREKLGKIVFANQNLLKKLNKITHPEIIKLIKKEISLAKNNSKEEKKILIIDAALIYETKIDRLMDKIIVVYLDEEKQLKRLKKRNNLAEKEALQKIKSQIPLKEKIERADYVIDNDDTLDKTRKQVEKIWEELMSLADSG
ncbi:MAG: dephospho-CoA kinase [Candidatus Infernicultor aquiphilus]|uniref:Dephospho-CoA kinase n=1 Tax=Candidatus Infernicultor aquiphilus TaxID=1805029 RepID=A0A2M7PU80_9BACT|nr:dephospho-CoA kinase [bacterium]PIU25621.1 MAG: dephospho-CoA kinase [Candidatus Atribacteria bacterium CG08_land_8_20_14_0_20_33_29]PIW12289.1 MAG: dephospho-CoA kinase [Candidatus Atribacteria bacterium CG17_big_fil_post_rev_8_21_14_2_50_34_11]PIX33607.1 MAG: dephospho-CoA kinase [Candidatus Atribacteria bacterium CG_4_8_14_3_um_filter_34_18]PIY33961.1 MAG: dephospho-CoA kinase [Candidatus Atribacteria bacterium CG_4_10_14_3_um_filter_34_13]PJB56225.1 MAG: dephospho-CoA kinase [Candidatus